jgi:hypothetical protein
MEAAEATMTRLPDRTLGSEGSISAHRHQARDSKELIFEEPSIAGRPVVWSKVSGQAELVYPGILSKAVGGPSS